MIGTVQGAPWVHEVLGAVAVGAWFPAFLLYLHNVVRGRTRPHAFTWLVWSALNAISFSAQVSNHGGPGSWVSAAVCLGNIVIFVSALFRGEKNVVPADWICLLGAAAAGVAWIVTRGPLLSVVLISIVDGFGAAPTFRKSYRKPREEAALPYALGTVAFLTSVAALQHRAIETMLYPLFIVVVDAALISMILVRRQALRLEPGRAS
jgi:hypothetical protein